VLLKEASGLIQPPALIVNNTMTFRAARANHNTTLIKAGPPSIASINIRVSGAENQSFIL
jgi:hypothetical protein